LHVTRYHAKGFRHSRLIFKEHFLKMAHGV
jgi:hypothetical protein